MPPKARYEKLTRGAQLPKAIEFLRGMRCDYMAPIGNWACDVAISEMHEKGLLIYPANAGLHGQPHKHLRSHFRDTVINAMNTAVDIYRGREVQPVRDRKLKHVMNLVRDLEILIDTSTFHGVHLVGDEHAIDDANKLLQSLNIVIGKNKRSPTPSKTGDYLTANFTHYMRNLWHNITGKEIAYPHNRLLVDLAVGIWIDAQLPDYEIEEARLHGRVTGWFSPK